MPIGAWILFGLIAFAIATIALSLIAEMPYPMVIIVVVVIALAIIGLILYGMMWYYDSTASGQRAMVDQQSNLNNGLERTVTIYTADGDVIAQYSGHIDISANDGGYVKFDFEGKRYIYYNCFVESIAVIPD